jgi:hypothetical protein
VAQDDGTKELWQQHRQSQDKYTYFLLAAAASALAFAIQKTESCTVSWELALAGLAAVAWGTSFYCGCQQIVWVQTSLYANHSLLELKAGKHRDQPSSHEGFALAVHVVQQTIDENGRAAQRHAIWQFRTLVLGGAFFIAWHVTQILRGGCVV